MLDLLVQWRHDHYAAQQFFRKLLKRLTHVPRVLITDKLASNGAAQREVLPCVEHWEQQPLNNHAEKSHQPTRQRERWSLRLPKPYGAAPRAMSKQP